MKWIVLGMWIPAIAGAVIGGVPADDTNSVLLILDQKRGATGTRIGPRTILCAGHSVFETAVEKIQVYQVDSTNEWTEYSVVKKTVPPAYIETQDRGHDFALLLLSEDLEGEPRPLKFAPLERGVDFSVSGFGATTLDGRPVLKRLGGTNHLPTRQTELFEFLKSEAWEKYGIVRFFGRITGDDGEAGTDVSPDAGDSGLGLIQDGTVRAVYSGSHGDPEVSRMSLAAVPLWSPKNRKFLEDSRPVFPFETVE